MKLLCVTAHPDDEAGNFGGTLLKYAHQGVETHVICLTPGQAARNRGNTRSDEELAETRRQEFAASCKRLKVSSGQVLNYRDGALDKASFSSVVGELAGYIRRLRPEVVITMGSEGGITAHPDHSMASLFATLAFHWAGRSNRFPEQLTNGVKPHRSQKLYYATASFTIPDRQPVSLAPVSAVIDVAEFLEGKIAAFKLHTTQAPLFPLFEKLTKQLGGVERFHLAATTIPRQAEPETDLFAGITG